MPVKPLSVMSNGVSRVPEVTVTDTGPILHLHEIDQLRPLRMFKLLHMPTAVEAELIQKGAFPKIKKAIGKFIKVESVDKNSPMMWL